LSQPRGQVHPLSERPPEEWTAAVQTDIANVAILCANCHRMIHRRKPALSIDELRALLAANLSVSVTNDIDRNS